MNNDRMEKELRLLRRMSSLILAEQPFLAIPVEGESEGLLKLVTEISSTLEADAATLFLRNEKQQQDDPVYDHAADPDDPVHDYPASPPREFTIRATVGLKASSIGVTTIRSGEGLVGASIQEKKIISVADGPSDPRYIYKPETGEENFKGFIAAPIIKDDEAIGILVLHYVRERTVSPDEIRLIAAVTEQMGFAIEHARLFFELGQRMNDMVSLYQVSRSLGRSLDLKGVLGEIVMQSMRIIPCRAAILRSLDVAQNRLIVEAISGKLVESAGALEPLAVGVGAAGAAAEQARPIVVEKRDDRERHHGEQHHPAAVAGEAVNILAVPLIHKNRVVGTLELLDRRPAPGSRTAEFTDSDQRLLSILAQSAAEAYSRAELYAEIESMALMYMRKNQELTILNQISHEIQGSRSMNEIFYIILTGITSGHGLSYNRAIAFLIDPEEGRELRGVFGIGATFEAVNRVWSEAPERFRTLGDYFNTIDPASLDPSPFNELIKTIRIPMPSPIAPGGPVAQAGSSGSSSSSSIFSRVVAERRSFNVRTLPGSGPDREFAEKIGSSAYVVVPIRTRDLIIGVIAVDNCFTKKPIHDQELILLETIANQCGLAIESARMISELERAMEKLEVTTEKLVEAERYAAIGEVAAGVAHDIRNPLTAIGGFTRRLGKRLPPGDMGHTYIEIIEKETSRLEKLAAEVLELASERRIHPVESNLSSIMRQWCETHEMLLKSHKVECILEPEPLYASVDPMVIGRAVSNIMQNAVDAVSPGGQILCGGRMTESAVIIEIADNGCGMTDEELSNIFKPFFTTKTEGTGLGLALAHKAVVAHHGSIHVQSAPGEGTTMKIVLPR